MELRWAHRLDVCVPRGTPKNVDDLPSHVERGENHSGEHQVIWQPRDRPMPGSVQDFFFRPTTGKEERNAAQIHHADGISQKRHRHDPAQAAHFADILLVMKSVNDRARTEEEQCFEEAMRDQVHDPGRDATDT